MSLTLGARAKMHQRWESNAEDSDSCSDRFHKVGKGWRWEGNREDV